MNVKASDEKKAGRRARAGAPKTARAVEPPEGLESDPKRGRPRVAPDAGDMLGAAELAGHVAKALRDQRKLQGLSLDELAQKCGVSRAALSQIEGARTNPTLAVLWKIAVGLGLPFQQLLGASGGDGPKVLRGTDNSPLRSANGQMESRLLSPGGTPPGVELYELRIAPKGSYRSEPHSKGTTETLVVMTGALRVIVGSDFFELAVGDSIFFNADVSHTYESRSTHLTRCIDLIVYPRG